MASPRQRRNIGVFGLVVSTGLLALSLYALATGRDVAGSIAILIVAAVFWIAHLLILRSGLRDGSRLDRNGDHA